MIRDYANRLLFGGGIVFDLFKWVIVLIIALIIVNRFFMTVFFVDGLSMYPTLKDKELVLLNKSVYGKSDPGRGDVVAVKYPGDPNHKRYVKRVVGLPGEQVDIIGGKVYINKTILKEEYLERGVETDPPLSKKLKAGEYFLMGDNRPGSNDSRYFGPVEKRFISGKAIAVIFPGAKNLTK